MFIGVFIIVGRWFVTWRQYRSIGKAELSYQLRVSFSCRPGCIPCLDDVTSSPLIYT